jgi:hypothetical protein
MARRLRCFPCHEGVDQLLAVSAVRHRLELGQRRKQPLDERAGSARGQESRRGEVRDEAFPNVCDRVAKPTLPSHRLLLPLPTEHERGQVVDRSLEAFVQIPRSERLCANTCRLEKAQNGPCSDALFGCVQVCASHISAIRVKPWLAHDWRTAGASANVHLRPAATAEAKLLLDSYLDRTGAGDWRKPAAIEAGTLTRY